MTEWLQHLRPLPLLLRALLEPCLPHSPTATLPSRVPCLLEPHLELIRSSQVIPHSLEPIRSNPAILHSLEPTHSNPAILPNQVPCLLEPPLELIRSNLVMHPSLVRSSPVMPSLRPPRPRHLQQNRKKKA